jgi:hypothetical protein
MPELKELQRAGIALQQQQNADILSRKIGGLSVPPRLLAMNAAYALFADRLLGNERFEIPYAALAAARRRNRRQLNRRTYRDLGS